MKKRLCRIWMMISVLLIVSMACSFNSVIDRVVGGIIGGGKVITPENAAEVNELVRFEKPNIQELLWSPDGKEIVVAIDSNIYFFDSENLTERLNITESRVYNIAFSPNGQVLASGNFDGTIQLWDVETGEIFRAWEAHMDIIYSLAFSPDNSVLASLSRDYTIKTWEVDSGLLKMSRDLQTQDGTSAASSALAFSPNGLILASGSGKGTIIFWDPANGTLLREIEGHSGSVRDITFSPDGTLLASAGMDGSVRLWDVETGMSLNILQTGAGYVESVSFSKDGQVLASGNRDGTVRLWDVKSAQLLLAREAHVGEIWVGSATLENPCSDDPPLPTTPREDHPYLIVTPTCGEPTTQETGEDGTVEIIPGTELRVEGNNFLPDVVVEFFWFDPTGFQFRQRQDGQDVTIATDENGEFFIDIIWPYRILPPSYQEGITEWELQGRQFTNSITGVGRKVTFVPSVVFSPLGDALASWGDDGTIRLWGIP